MWTMWTNIFPKRNVRRLHSKNDVSVVREREREREREKLNVTQIKSSKSTLPQLCGPIISKRGLLPLDFFFDGNSFPCDYIIIMWPSKKYLVGHCDFLIHLWSHNIECNNSFLVSLLKSGRLFGWIIEDVREILLLFCSISFNYVSNSCNKVAHALAGFAKEKDDLADWLEDCPSFLFPMVVN